MVRYNKHMRNDKHSDTEQAKETSSGFDPELEAKVDALMDTEQATQPSAVDSDDHIVILPSAPMVSDDVPEQIDEIQLVQNNQPIMPDPSSEQSLDAAEPELSVNEPDITPEAEDPTLDAAVDDITIAEADAVLAAEDAKVAAVAEDILVPKKRHPIRSFFASWWENPIARWATIFLLVGGIIAAAAVPPSRYFILNMAGVRSSASVVVIDESTGQPLQNVQVQLGAVSTKTNEDGLARLADVKLGSQQLNITRVAFAPLSQKVTIGWGSNPLGEQELKATGVQYVFNVTDFLSGKPVTTATASRGEATAQANEKGVIVLTLEDPEGDTVTVNLNADGYRSEELTIPATTTDPQSVKMVPSQPLVYVSKQQGKFDVYKVDVDGKNKKIVLAGTGLERPSMSLLTNAEGSYSAFVSSREKRYDSENYLLDTLSLIDLKTGAVKTIDQAQNIQLIAWKGDTLVYRAAYAAPSAATNDRQRLIAYDVAKSARTPLANGNYFVGIYAVGDYVYYGVTTPGAGEGGVFARTKFDGSDKKSLESGAIWTVNQTKPNELFVSIEDTWYRYDTSTNALSKQPAPQDTYLAPQYFMAPGKAYGAMIDQRDGQGVLVYANDDKPGKTLANARGLFGPVTWLNDTTLSYYVDNGSETALYVVNTEGGEPVRVSSVTLVSGASAGYY